MINLNIFKDINSLAEAIINDLDSLSHSGTIKNIAIPGGNTPKKIFKIISETSRIKWENIRIFWTDERCVSPDNKESNYLLAKKFLLNRINIPEKNIFRIKGENNPEDEAIRYSKIISEILGSTPSFDLILAGVGMDGHTASLFPGQAELLFSFNNYEVSTKSEINNRRITMTGKLFFNAKKIIFCVTGNNKSSIIQKIVETDFQCPVSTIIKIKKKYFLYADENAAKLLKD